VIFIILFLLLVPAVYRMSITTSKSDVSAERADSNYLNNGTCTSKTTDPRTGKVQQTCCWTETERGPYSKIGTTEVRYCQTCSTAPCGSGPLDCKQSRYNL
jgi:hypothetical protein